MEKNPLKIFWFKTISNIRNNLYRLYIDICLLFKKKPTWVIPQGPYCYKLKKVVYDKKYQARLLCNYCPYFSRKKVGDHFEAYCRYLETTDCILLDDSCKICEIKDKYEGEENDS